MHRSDLGFDHGSLRCAARLCDSSVSVHGIRTRCHHTVGSCQHVHASADVFFRTITLMPVSITARCSVQRFCAIPQLHCTSAYIISVDPPKFTCYSTKKNRLVLWCVVDVEFFGFDHIVQRCAACICDTTVSMSMYARKNLSDVNIIMYVCTDLI